MTFDDYIKNPMGSAVMTNRLMYQNMYTEKWNSIKLRENGFINRTLYQKGNNYYIHFKIPSEVVPKFYYDTIIRFYLSKDNKSDPNSKSLSDYDVQFYSNDPSFVYTFAHAFKKNDLFINDLESRMSEKALKEKATEKNPKDEVGYVKSLYFAYLEFKGGNLFQKVRWEGAASKPYSKKVWDTTVTHADEKVLDRQEKGAALAKKERKANQEKKATQNIERSSNNSFTRKMNDPDFGKFKKTDYNTIAKASHGINKLIGRFKKNKPS